MLIFSNDPYLSLSNTDKQKADLFAKVRAGQVRVLIGSTFKMGAGTNAQTLLKALHHLEAPWRPSDVEQREGRILRQGNRNTEVEIYRYVTESTFDSYSWGLLEKKQRFISQIMRNSAVDRNAEDIDSTALSFAEIKALAAGDPRIKEMMDLEVRVEKLSILKRSYLSQRHSLEDLAGDGYPKLEQRLTREISELQTDIAALGGQDERFIINGVVFDERSEAGNALAKAMEQGEENLGGYMGFSMIWRDISHMCLQGKGSYVFDIGTSGLGNITRIENAVQKLPEILSQKQNQLDETRANIVTAKEQLAQPFAQEDELREKTARLHLLRVEMDMGKTETEGIAADTSDAPAQEIHEVSVDVMAR